MATTGFAYKTSDDVGAPVMTGAAGSMIPVLDWLLSPAYWDKVFTGTNKAVYRAKAGTRDFLRVDDNQLSSAKVRAYRDMTSVDAGTFPYPTLTQATKYTWFKSNAAATARPYKAIVTDRFLLLWTETGYSTGVGRGIYWFGDLAPCQLGGQAVSAIFGAFEDSNISSALGVNGASNTLYGGFGNNLNRLLVAGTYDGNPSLMRGFTSKFSDGTDLPAPTSVSNLAPNNQAMPLMAPIAILDTIVSSPFQNSSTSAVVAIGRVPFLFHLNTFPLSLGDQLQDAGGGNYVFLPSSGGNAQGATDLQTCFMTTDRELGLP